MFCKVFVDGGYVAVLRELGLIYIWNSGLEFVRSLIFMN